WLRFLHFGLRAPHERGITSRPSPPSSCVALVRANRRAYTTSHHLRGCCFCRMPWRPWRGPSPRNSIWLPESQTSPHPESSGPISTHSSPFWTRHLPVVSLSNANTLSEPLRIYCSAQYSPTSSISMPETLDLISLAVSLRKVSAVLAAVVAISPAAMAMTAQQTVGDFCIVEPPLS